MSCSAGAAAAFLAQVVIAVAAGGALSLLPHRIVEACAAGVFVVGAVLLWRQHEEEQRRQEKDDDDSGRDGVRSGFWPVFGTAFAVVFLAEFGDLTQFMTVSLAARYHDPISVGIGATLALWVAAGARRHARLARAQADPHAVADQGRGRGDAGPRGHERVRGRELSAGDAVRSEIRALGLALIGAQVRIRFINA